MVSTPSRYRVLLARPQRLRLVHDQRVRPPLLLTPSPSPIWRLLAERALDEVLVGHGTVCHEGGQGLYLGQHHEERGSPRARPPHRHREARPDLHQGELFSPARPCGLPTRPVWLCACPPAVGNCLFVFCCVPLPYGEFDYFPTLRPVFG